MQTHRIAMLGTGLIADFYLTALHGQRGRDRVVTAFSRSAERGRAFAARWGIAASTTSMEEAIGYPEVDVVVVALPNKGAANNFFSPPALSEVHLVEPQGHTPVAGCFLPDTLSGSHIHPAP